MSTSAHPQIRSPLFTIYPGWLTVPNCHWEKARRIQTAREHVWSAKMQKCENGQCIKCEIKCEDDIVFYTCAKMRMRNRWATTYVCHLEGPMASCFDSADDISSAAWHLKSSSAILAISDNCSNGVDFSASDFVLMVVLSALSTSFAWLEALQAMQHIRQLSKEKSEMIGGEYLH